MILFHHDGSEQRRNDKQYKHQRDDLSEDALRTPDNEGGYKAQPQQDQDYRYGRIHHNDSHQGFQQLVPRTFLFDG